VAPKGGGGSRNPGKHSLLGLGERKWEAHGRQDETRGNPKRGNQKREVKITKRGRKTSKGKKRKREDETNLNLASFCQGNSKTKSGKFLTA